MRYFFDPDPLGRPKIGVQGTFTDTIVRLEAFNRLFLLRQQIDFFSKG